MNRLDFLWSLFQFWNLHYVKSYCIWSICICPYFSAFRLNVEKYGVSLCIQSKCGKTRAKKTMNRYTFYAVLVFVNASGWSKGWARGHLFFAAFGEKLNTLFLVIVQPCVSFKLRSSFGMLMKRISLSEGDSWYLSIDVGVKIIFLTFSFREKRRDI